MSPTVERRASRPSSRAGTPGSPLMTPDFLAKDARGIGGKLDQGHACIPAIEIFILSEKSIALAQILRPRIEDAPAFAGHHLEHFAFALPLRHLFADRGADRATLPRRSVAVNDLHQRTARSPRRIQRLEQSPLRLLDRRHPRLKIQ